MAALTCRRGLLSLFSWLFLLATTVSSLPKPAQERDMAPNLLQNANLSTELKPQTLSEEDLPPGYLLIVNLYAVKNASGETVDDMLEDEVFENVTEHRGHVASILVLFDEDKEDENAVDLAGFAQEIANDGAHVQAYEKDGKVRMLIVDLELMDLESALNWTTNNNPERMSKVRTRRSACLKCSGGGGGKGGGGGWMMMGGGCGNLCQTMRRPSRRGCGGGGNCGGGGGVSAIPVYVVPVGITGGQGGGMRGGGHHGGGGGRYGGGHYGGGGYPGGGGCNSCQQGYGGNGGGGYGGSYSQAQSSASSSSYGWGGKK